MIKIWAKTMKKSKIIKSYVLQKDEIFNINEFYNYATEICHNLDIETPLILSKHLNDFVSFNNAIFKKDDFIDKINFEYLIFENIAEE